MLLSYNELIALQNDGVIEYSLPEHVNATSIDITLGRYILVECEDMARVVSVAERTKLQTYQIDLQKGPLLLPPGHFILAQSEQIFNLPNDLSAEYKLKSSLARIGLEHMNAGWCDAGWHGSVLTLEFKNMTNRHFIELQQGDRIGQVIFMRHVPVPDFASYATRGRYNNDTQVCGVKL